MHKKSLIASAVVNFRDEETTTVKLNDFASDLPSERKFKDSGAMIAPCTIARTGIMQYRASECGTLFKDRDPNSIVKIATLEEDLFCKDSLESYRSAPITVNHPKEDVTIKNAKDLQKGNLDSVPFADGALLSGHIVINDEDTLKLIDEGTSQLSSGHSCTLVMADSNLEYDAYKTKIRANHIAIVESGRAGSARIADEALNVPTPTIEEIAEKHGKDVSVLKDALQKGIEVEKEHTTDVAKAEEIALDHLSESPEYYDELEEMEKDLKADLKDSEIKLKDMETILEDTNKELDATKAKLDDALNKVALSDEALKVAEAKISDAAIEELVTKRLAFVQEVATLTDMNITGLSDIEAKRAVVAELRDKDMSDKSVAYIECAYDIALEDCDNESPMTNLLRKQVKVEINDKAVEPKSKAQIARERAIARTQGNK